MNSGREKAELLANKWWEIWGKVDPGQNKGRQKSVFGDIFEELIMDYLRSEVKLNEKYKIKKGLINKDKKLSPQADIIIYSGEGIYENTSLPTAIVKSEDVKLVIEAKSYLDLSVYKSLPKQIERIKEYCNNETKMCVMTAQLATPIEEDKVAEKFYFCDYFTILYRRENKKDYYDYGNGFDKFLQYLEELNNL